MVVLRTWRRADGKDFKRTNPVESHIGFEDSAIRGIVRAVADGGLAVVHAQFAR